ncbi:hypothetical protein [Olleya aquimaris]|uniref:Uncharacterized protein n=1 Tax=Olleya aquimaris TaxID=639310 RepID=A0A327RLR6_9FLAO|nr:hypothetical protein [Olleya aquimaris]RAJ17970.1 hypothetical protein LY08_00240 [Olleya aquimaris]
MRLSLLCIVCCVFNLSAQEDDTPKTINDFNFESTTNPAFSILEETPTAINTPENLKSLALYVSNGFANGNIALETNPYWLLSNKKDKSYKDYRGISTNKKSEYRIDPFKSLQTNTSFSLGYIQKKFEGFEEAKKTLAIGLRTTLFEYYGKERTTTLLDVINIVDKAYTNEALTKFDKYIRGFNETTPNRKKCEDFIENGNIPKNYSDAAVKFLEKYEQYKTNYIDADALVKAYFTETSKKVLDFYFNPKNIKPLIRLDGAVAYSLLFKENEINSSTANRVGSWLTLDVAFQFNDKNYLHLYGIGRYIDNGFNVDETLNYFNENFWDVGGKLELELNNFKLAYEYLERSGNDEQFRSVGNITYQINPKISITGGFGKDFPVKDNLITIIGINWGLDLGEGAFTN